MRALRFLAPLLLAAAALAPSVARAENPKLHLQRADVSLFPLVKAYITWVEPDGRLVTGKQREDFKFVFDSNEQGPAADVKPLEQTGEPTYLVVVLQVGGQLQADTSAFDDAKRGVKTLASAVGEAKGSKVALITYGQDVKRTFELGKPEELEGKLTGLQVDTEGSELHLLDAIRQAIDILNAKGVPDEARKMILVFSDGTEFAGTEKKMFGELGKRALLSGTDPTKGAGIVIDTIAYNPLEDKMGKNLAELAKQSNGIDRKCKNAQDVTAQFGNVADEIRKQYVVLFQSTVVGAGKPHDIQVKNDTGGKEIYSEVIQKLCIDNKPPEAAEVPFYKKWWFWTALGVGLVAIIGLLAVVLGGKKQEMAPVEVGPPMPMPMETGGPMKTMALDLNALQGKGPTIGWIVGVTGRYADQTFKLKAGGRTLIGTAPDSDIVIDDAAMSSKHCEVRYDGNTYKIVDLGSTNGVVLNDKKVREYDLVDGDTLRLGRTEFKFKSIN